MHALENIICYPCSSVVYSYTSKPPRGRRGEHTCPVPSAQAITSHRLSETNSSSNSITHSTCSWCAQKSEEVTEFKKGSSNINASVKLVRKDFNCQKETMQTSSLSPPRQGADAQRGRVRFLQRYSQSQDWFRKTRGELATPYLEGRHMNT